MSSEKSINWLTAGANIRRYRVGKRMTQKQLGQALGVSASMVSQLESGTKHPSTEQLYAIANCLDVTMDELTRDLTAAERARLLLGLDLPLLLRHLEDAGAAIENARANARGIEAELSLGARLARLSGQPVVKTVIEMMSDQGLVVSHEVTDDGQHTVTAVDQATAKTHSATHADLYAAVCEAAQAAGFDLEDG